MKERKKNKLSHPFDLNSRMVFYKTDWAGIIGIIAIIAAIIIVWKAFEIEDKGLITDALFAAVAIITAAVQIYQRKSNK